MVMRCVEGAVRSEVNKTVEQQRNMEEEQALDTAQQN